MCHDHDVEFILVQVLYCILVTATDTVIVLAFMDVYIDL